MFTLWLYNLSYIQALLEIHDDIILPFLHSQILFGSP